MPVPSHEYHLVFHRRHMDMPFTSLLGHCFLFNDYRYTFRVTTFQIGRISTFPLRSRNYKQVKRDCPTSNPSIKTKPILIHPKGFFLFYSFQSFQSFQCCRIRRTSHIEIQYFPLLIQQDKTRDRPYPISIHKSPVATCMQLNTA